MTRAEAHEIARKIIDALHQQGFQSGAYVSDEFFEPVGTTDGGTVVLDGWFNLTQAVEDAFCTKDETS